jgi:hypothetical protein
MAELPAGWIFIPKMKDAVTITVEKRELVVCKDCKYSEKMCKPWDDIVCTRNRATHCPDWFCADGERRDT